MGPSVPGDPEHKETPDAGGRKGRHPDAQWAALLWAGRPHSGDLVLEWVRCTITPGSCPAETPTAVLRVSRTGAGMPECRGWQGEARAGGFREVSPTLLVRE